MQIKKFIKQQQDPFGTKVLSSQQLLSISKLESKCKKIDPSVLFEVHQTMSIYRDEVILKIYIDKPFLLEYSSPIMPLKKASLLATLHLTNRTYTIKIDNQIHNPLPQKEEKLLSLIVDSFENSYSFN